VSGLRASVCMWPRLPRVCAAQAMPVGHGLLVVVAQRVSYTTKVCAHKIKDLPVAHGCRAAAGLPPPSPLDDRRVIVSWERMAQREQETRTWGFVVWSLAVCAGYRAQPVMDAYIDAYICNICGVQPIVADTSPLRKPPYDVDATMRLRHLEAGWS